MLRLYVFCLPRYVFLTICLWTMPQDKTWYLPSTLSFIIMALELRMYDTYLEKKKKKRRIS